MKQLHLTHNGKEYTLEFTRKTVERMEREGFLIGDIVDKPAITLPTLFAGAFYANHPFDAPRKVTDAIFDTISNKRELIGKLAEMYNEPISAMMEDPADEAGNANWTANW